MLMSLLSHVLSAWFAFLLPCYSTFKALSHRPLSEPELQRWSMYWCVIGAFVAFEYMAEWLISWLPFYWEIKTLFLLFLALPQTQGSTYIYTTYLQPFFMKNEADLDAGIVSLQTNILAFLHDRLSSLWNLVWSLLNKNAAAGQNVAGQPGAGQSGAPAISLQSAIGLWQTYGSSVMNALHPRAAPSTPGASASSTSVQNNSADQRSFTSARESPVPTPYNLSPAASFSQAPPPFPEPLHY